MKVLSLVGAVALVALLAGCSSPARCGRGDWCACSNGTECFQDCDDVDGCRIFCFDMLRCGASCGNDCNFEFHDATDSQVTCGDACHFSCHDGVTCTVHAGAGGDHTCYAMEACTISGDARAKARRSGRGWRGRARGWIDDGPARAKHAGPV